MDIIILLTCIQISMKLTYICIPISSVYHVLLYTMSAVVNDFQTDVSGFHFNPFGPELSPSTQGVTLLPMNMVKLF